MSGDMGDNFIDSAETEKLKETEDQARRRRKRELNDISKVLDIVEGRRLIWRLLSETGVYRSSFTQDSLQTAFNEGRRDIGLVILTDMNLAKPGAFAQLQREAISEANSKNAKNI